jgi:hypothetical protein
MPAREDSLLRIALALAATQDRSLDPHYKARMTLKEFRALIDADKLSNSRSMLGRPVSGQASTDNLALAHLDRLTLEQLKQRC